MKKELDTFSLDFAVELQDYPKMNTFPSRKGKPEMFRFNGGYYSFDEEGKMDDCHLYVQDYQGNNRMVVNAYTDEVEQINHYYPYGALMADISTNSDEQKYKFGGKELDRTYGLDLHDFEARQQDPLIGRFSAIDPMAEKYYGVSPYVYCAGNPVNCVDPDGKDAKIIIENYNITISSNIVLTGPYATQELADLYKKGIMDEWGKITSFIAEDGTEYSVSWNIEVTVNNDIDLDAGDVPERDGLTNYMQVMNQQTVDSSGKLRHSGLSLSPGYTGHIRAFANGVGDLGETNPMPHEFGHMMGLKDRYHKNKGITNGPQTYGTPCSGWEGAIMAMPAGLGVAESKQIGGPVNYSINYQRMCFYWVKPCPISWKALGIRVGVGYYHE